MKVIIGVLVLMEFAAFYLFLQADSLPSPPPVNPVYAALLALLNVLIAGIVIGGWKFYQSVQKSSQGITEVLHKMDKRLYRVELKLGINEE